MALQVTVTHLSGGQVNETEVFRKFPITVGRADSCALQFDPEHEVYVSALHAELDQRDDGSLQVTDLESANGTFVNDVRIEGPEPVPNEAILQFGEGGPRVRITLEEAGGISFTALRSGQQPKSITPGRKVVGTERYDKKGEDAGAQGPKLDLDIDEIKRDLGSGRSVALIVLGIAVIVVVGAIVAIASS